MSINEQPNEMLDLILNTATIPLPQRMRLRAVSRRWLPVLKDGLARETALVISEENVFHLESKPDHLVIQRGILTEEIIRTLVRLFPTPTELILAFGKWDNPSISWSTVPSLLAQIGTNLTSVKLHGSIDEAEAEPLARSLAALSNLTSLTLSDYHFNVRLLPYLGPVLSRLEAFACPNPIALESASFIEPFLSPRCTRLLLNQEVLDSFSGPLIAQFVSSLTYLHLVGCDLTTVSETLSQMHGLTSLALDFNYTEVTDLDSSLFCRFTDMLTPFARLTDLKLLGFIGRIPLALPSMMEKPLSAIQRLTLQVEFSFDVDYGDFFKSIGVWFPGMTRLTFITTEDTFPDIRASLGKQSFSVKTVDSLHFDSWAPDW